MTRLVRHIILFLMVVLFQVTILPAGIADPFKPNLLLVTIVWIGLTIPSLWGAALVYLLGLAHDTVSGLYLGLNGISYLIAFLALNSVAHRLYADSRYLMTLAVFLSTLLCGISQLVLLALFSSAGGIVSTLVSSLVPQSLVNALTASFIFSIVDRQKTEESG